MFKVVAKENYLEECVNAKQMLNSFDNFATIDNTNKYKAEIATYISSIKQFKGFGVKVHLLSPYDSCDREIQEHFKSVDADIVGARMGLSTALMECVMFLPEPMRHNWEVLTKPNLTNKYVQNRILGVTHPIVKNFSCFGRLGDLCILKELQSGEICNLECKWHGQYDVGDTDKNTNLQKSCSRMAKRIPVLKKPRFDKYPHFCNRSYPALNNKVSYHCVGNEKVGYYFYRQQTELELNRHP